MPIQLIQRRYAKQPWPVAAAQFIANKFFNELACADPGSRQHGQPYVILARRLP